MVLTPEKERRKGVLYVTENMEGGRYGEGRAGGSTKVAMAVSS
jgi:hypothetical protein